MICPCNNNYPCVRAECPQIFIGTPHPGAFLTHVEKPAAIKDNTPIAHALEIACLNGEQPEQMEGPLARIGSAFRQADPVHRNISVCLGTSCISSGANVRFFPF